ncbi:MAG TPA: T9SS type A sorting domain-containing protein, partial [Ferruginibacter sp.]|nr:T9SS type A sorting domain-containing protein [Ferruginibacter sp.]
CNGGSATVTVSATGGTAPYTGTGTFTVNAGTFNYTVTDAAGGSSTASVTVSQPALLTATVAAGTVATASATTSATITATGGTPGYTYSLDGGLFQSSNIFASVGAGSHTATVKDGKGCTAQKSFTVSVTGTSPLVISSVAGTIACYGGTTSIVMTATGGVGPYVGTGTFTVSAGTYTYTITDAAGTTGTNAVTVTQPAAVSVSLTAGAITVSGGTTSITVTATGGNGGYTYSRNGTSYQSSNIFTLVPVGTYSITVKDSKGCTAVKSITITQTVVSGGPFEIYLVSKTNETCRNRRDGIITVSARGGTAPYLYKLNNGAYSSNTVFRNLSPGLYKVTSKDSRNIPSWIYVNINKSNKSCNSGARSGEEDSVDQGKTSTPELLKTPASLTLQVNAFPNPTVNEFSLMIENGNPDEPIQIVVMDLNGRKMYEAKARLHEKKIFGRDFMSGVYIVKVVQGKDIQTLKLIKAK